MTERQKNKGTGRQKERYRKTEAKDTGGQKKKQEERPKDTGKHKLKHRRTERKKD